MVQERAQRRLAAVLVADVVGYSRLMEADESGTLAALKDRRARIIEPLVAEHQGRIFKQMGDSALVEFASAVNAVACAIDLQKAMTGAGSADGRRIQLRVGVLGMSSLRAAISMARGLTSPRGWKRLPSPVQSWSRRRCSTMSEAKPALASMTGASRR
jgi:class 3 adenylate cyclase